jgi:nucleotide-binding universal stress UspA family protein
MNMIYGFRSILVATDFSTHSEAAMKQAIWLSRNSGARVVLAHVLPDLRLAIPDPFSVQQFDPLQGEEERFRSDIIEETEARLRLLIDQVGAKDLGVQYQVLSGDPSIALIPAVQQEKFDLVLVGMRGLAPWERFTMGCTSKRLVRKCPSPVWTIHADRAIPPGPFWPRQIFRRSVGQQHFMGNASQVKRVLSSTYYTWSIPLEFRQ